MNDPTLLTEYESTSYTELRLSASVGGLKLIPANSAFLGGTFGERGQRASHWGLENFQ